MERKEHEKQDLLALNEDLHQKRDFTMKNFEIRQTARNEEFEARSREGEEGVLDDMRSKSSRASTTTEHHFRQGETSSCRSAPFWRRRWTPSTPTRCSWLVRTAGSKTKEYHQDECAWQKLLTAAVKERSVAESVAEAKLLYQSMSSPGPPQPSCDSSMEDKQMRAWRDFPFVVGMDHLALQVQELQRDGVPRLCKCQSQDMGLPMVFFRTDLSSSRRLSGFDSAQAVWWFPKRKTAYLVGHDLFLA